MKVQIERSVYGGAGLAHQTEGADAGRTVFVPFTLPGEWVEARLTGRKEGFDEAALMGVVEASADRVSPRCGHFGLCGGCQYQHAGYAAQVAMKVAILRETLGRTGLADLPGVEVHSGEAWGYRNRVRLRVEVVDGALRVGYNRRGSNEFLAIRECPIAGPLLWRAAESLLWIGGEDSAAGRWVRGVDEVEFFCDGGETTLQMTAFVRKERVGGFTEFCERLQGLVGVLAGAGVALISPRNVQKVRQLQSWGASGLSYTVAGERYWVGVVVFFR
ncbi:MAG: hypothetical protein ABI072_00110 [Edaphobacter sp.]